VEITWTQARGIFGEEWIQLRQIIEKIKGLIPVEESQGQKLEKVIARLSKEFGYYLPIALVCKKDIGESFVTRLILVDRHGAPHIFNACIVSEAHSPRIGGSRYVVADLGGFKVFARVVREPSPRGVKLYRAIVERIEPRDRLGLILAEVSRGRIPLMGKLVVEESSRWGLVARGSRVVPLEVVEEGRLPWELTLRLPSGEVVKPFEYWRPRITLYPLLDAILVRATSPNPTYNIDAVEYVTRDLPGFYYRTEIGYAKAVPIRNIQELLEAISKIVSQAKKLNLPIEISDKHLFIGKGKTKLKELIISE